VSNDNNSIRKKMIKSYDYLDKSGKLLFQTVRLDPKDFRQRRPDGQGGWVWNLDGVRKVPYRLPELLQASMQDWVFITEGEKDVDRLVAEGLSATCNPMGAGKWRAEYDRYFAGRLVAVIPDNDEPGMRHARQVAESLLGIAGEIRIVEVPGLDKGGDISDWLDCGGDRTKLLELVDMADPFEPAKGKRKRGTCLDNSKAEPILINLAEVEPQKVEWLWDNRIPMGKVSLLVGDPGLGKSFLTLYIAARVTTGAAWPDDPSEQPIFEGSAIILTAEDDISDTVLPRLQTNGADVSKVVAIQGVMYPDSEGQCHFSLTTHLPALEQAIVETSETRLVIIDPITAYLGNMDSHRNTDVRAALAPLAALAGKHKVAVLGVSHLTKNQGLKAVYRTMGSLAFTAAARAVWVVSKDKGNPNRRLLTPCKCNLSVEPTSLAFEIIDGMVCFEPEQLHISTDEALSEEGTEDKGALEEAVDFLREILKDGPAQSKQVRKEAGENKISEATLKRAKAKLGVVSKKTPEGWEMQLGDDDIPF